MGLRSLCHVLQLQRGLQAGLHGACSKRSSLQFLSGGICLACQEGCLCLRLPKDTTGWRVILRARGKYSLEQENKQMIIKCIICYSAVCQNVSQSDLLFHAINLWCITSYSSFHEVQYYSVTGGKLEKKKRHALNWWDAETSVLLILQTTSPFSHNITCLGT